MHFTSCKTCGVVVDANIIEFLPEPDWLEDDAEYHPEQLWENDYPMRTWECPVCKDYSHTGKVLD